MRGGKLLIWRRLRRANSPAAVRSPAPGNPGPPRSQTSARGLGCSGPASEDVDGAVRAPLLDGQRGLVPKARALSHYSGEPSWKRTDYSNLDRRPDRMPVYGAESRKKPGGDSGLYAPQPPAIPIAPLHRPTSPCSGRAASGAPLRGGVGRHNIRCLFFEAI